jgi:hypothetical protein
MLNKLSHVIDDRFVLRQGSLCSSLHKCSALFTPFNLLSLVSRLVIDPFANTATPMTALLLQ